MKKHLHAYAMCQSMFCAIPCPWNIWDEDARGEMLLFLPVVGLVIGLLWYAVRPLLCRHLCARLFCAHIRIVQQGSSIWMDLWT